MTDVAIIRTGHHAGTSGYRRVTAALCAAGLASFSAMYCTQALLPALSADYRVPPATATLTVSLTTGLLALCIIPVSVLSERYGRVNVMLISGVISSVIGLALPFSPSLGFLIAGRALQGIALAGVPAVAIAYLAEEIHAASLSSALGRYIAGNTVGALLGRVVPSEVVELTSWRVALVVCSLTTLAGTVVFALLVPRSQFFTPKVVGVRDVVRNLGGHLRKPLMIKLFLFGFLLMGSFVTMYNFLGFRLMEQPFRLKHSTVGLLFLLYIVGTWTSMAAGRFADRLGRVILLGIALPFVLAGLLVTTSQQLPIIVFGLGLFTGGFFAAHTVASGWVGAVAQNNRAEASGLYLFSSYLGGSVAGSLGGVIYGSGGWSSTAMFVGTLLVIALGLVGLLVNSTHARAVIMPNAIVESAYCGPGTDVLGS